MVFEKLKAKNLILEKAASLSVSKAMLERGIATRNYADVRRVLERLGNGEHITVLQLGGSITEGYFSTSPEKSQGGCVFSFLSDLFPDKITFINAGIAATGAVYGAYRLPQDVLCYHPDLVIVEYNINDRGSDREAMAAYESIVKNLRQKGIALISLYNTVFSENKASAAGSRDVIDKTASFYSLPSADANLAFFGEDFYEKSDSPGAYFKSTDGTHPTDAGHARVSLLVSYLLYKIMSSEEILPSPLPRKPLYPESLYITANSQIIKAQEIKAGHPKVKICGGEYLENPQSVGQNIILGAKSNGFAGGTRKNNTYTCYEIKKGESAKLEILDTCDAFIILMQNKFGAKEATFHICAEGEPPQTLIMNAHYSGALTVEHSRIINCDHRIYSGKKTNVTITITATDGNVYIGGVLATFC